MDLKPFWMSWESDGAFAWDGPWWVSAWILRADDTATDVICAAVMATDREDAMRRIVEAHDPPTGLVFRFAEERPLDWSPFCDRFERRTWMRWPYAGREVA